MSAHIEKASLLSGRQFAMVVTVALHAVVISALLAIKVVPEITAAVPRLLVSISEPRKIEPPVRVEPMPGPVIQGPVSRRVEKPEVPLFEETVVAQDPVSAPPGETAGGTLVPEPVVAPAVQSLGYRVVRPADEFFPPQSRILGEQGVAVVRACVGADGALLGMPVVERGSGYRRLDAAAVTWAREALQFTPARRDGVAVSACKSFRVVFTLR